MPSLCGTNLPWSQAAVPWLRSDNCKMLLVSQRMCGNVSRLCMMQSNLALQTLANLACPVRLCADAEWPQRRRHSLSLQARSPLAGSCHIKQSLNAHLGPHPCRACCICKIPHCRFACFRQPLITSQIYQENLSQCGCMRSHILNIYQIVHTAYHVGLTAPWAYCRC